MTITISPYGADEYAKEAICGVLREKGKLILSLENKDLIQMLETKDNKDPADWLSEKADGIFIDLGK